MYKRENGGIYKIENNVTKDFYVGSSVNIPHRFKGHKTLLRNNKHFSRYLQNAWNKYGEESFSFQVIEYSDLNLENLRKLEQKYLDRLSPAYNMSKKVEYFGTRVKNPKHQENLNNALRNSKIRKSKEYKENISSKIKKLWSDNTYRISQIKSITSQDALSKRRQTRMSIIESRDAVGYNKGVCSMDNIREMRRLYETGNYTHQELADMFSIKRRTASRIISRKSWNFI